MAKKKKSGGGKKSGIAKLWKTAKEQVEETPDMFATIEKGRYLAKLTSAVTTEIGDNNWKNFALGFEIQEGEQEGLVATRRCGIENEENFTYLIRDLQKLGVETDDLEINSEKELNQLGEDLVAAELMVRIRITDPNDQGFQNTYIDKLISADGAESEEEPETEEESEEVELEKGSRVSAEIEGEVYEGEIKKIKGTTATVEFDDCDSDTFELDELTALDAEEEDEGDEDLVGKTMGFKKGKKMLVGKILSVDDEDGTFEMKTDAGKKVTGNVDELETPEYAEEDEEEDEEVSFEKGERVQTEIEGDMYEGAVKKVKKNSAIVAFDDGDEVDVPFEELEKVDDTDAGGDFEVGDKVVVDYKGKDTKGTIKSVDDEENEAVVMLTKAKKKITVSLDDIVAA